MDVTYGLQGHETYNVFKPRIIKVPVAPYDINSFATVLQSLLNGGDKTIKGDYTVSRTSTDHNTGVTSVALAQNFTVTLSGVPANVGAAFHFPTDAYVKDKSWYNNHCMFWNKPENNPGSKPT